jgi:hypothetical protein
MSERIAVANGLNIIIRDGIFAGKLEKMEIRLVWFRLDPFVQVPSSFVIHSHVAKGFIARKSDFLFRPFLQSIHRAQEEGGIGDNEGKLAKETNCVSVKVELRGVRSVYHSIPEGHH